MNFKGYLALWGPAQVGRDWRPALALTKALAIAGFGWLLILLAADGVIRIALEDALAAAGSGDNDRWIYQVGLGVWDLVKSVTLILLLSGTVTQVRQLPRQLEAKPFAEPYFSSFIAEYLRVLAKVLLWALLLIVPGFYKYIRLAFVPFIALFAKRYRAGQVDALELSHQLTHGRILTLALVMIGTALVQAVFDYSPSAVALLHTLPIRLLFYAVSFLLSIWSYSFLFVVFERALEEHKWN